MIVKELVEKMNLTVFCGQDNLDREIKGGYFAIKPVIDGEIIL